MTITITDLAAELDIHEAVVEVYVDQIIGIDGHDATIAAENPIRNASGRVIGTEVALTDDAAQAVRDAYAAQLEVDVQGLEMLQEIEEANAAAMDQQVREAELLDEVLTSSALVGAFGQSHDAAIARRDAAIRAAFTYGVKRTAIAKAAGLRRERVYQIIDGR